MSPRVVVVGGGLAGLFTATELIAAGIDDVTVVEASDEPGGVARTIRRSGYSLEPAAGTLLLPHPHLTPVLEHLDGEVAAAQPEAALRHVYTRGRLIPLPSSPRALGAPLVPVTAKLRGALEPFVRRRGPEDDDEPLDAYLRRRLGDRLGGIAAWLAASGVFAGDPTRLSVGSAFPGLKALEDDAGSIARGMLRRLRARPKGTPRPSSHLPVGGMSHLADTAAGILGDRLRSNFPVESVHRDASTWRVEGPESVPADHVVLAVRPEDAARMIDTALSPILRRAVSAPVVVVGLGGTTDELPLPAGFGALTGPDAGTATRGVLFESSYAPERAPDGHALAKVIAGGAPRPEVAEWDDQEVVERIRAEVALILGVEISPSFVEVVRHSAGIPQYEVGHSRWLSDVEEASEAGLHLTGWGYRGVGVAHVAADAAATARRIIEEVGRRQ